LGTKLDKPPVFGEKIKKYPNTNKPPISWENTDKTPIFNPNYSPPCCGPTLMARGCLSALRLAAARPTHDTDS